MINHIFQLNSKAYILNLGIIESFIKLSRHSSDNSIKPRFILIEYYPEYTHYFIELFNHHKYNKYIIINKKNLSSLKLFSKDYPTILHGPTYSLIARLVLYGFKRLNWVCWGKGSRINKHNIKSIFFTPIKLYLYHHFKTIVTLLDGDKQSLQRHFHLKNITTIPYYSEREEKDNQFLEQLILSYKEPTKPIVILGNSGHCINDYISLIDELHIFKNEIEIHCMLSYGNDKNSKKRTLLEEKGKSIFGNDFIIDDKYLSFNEYLKYMNTASIYICGSETQSGLGAIYNMLLLGKKVFLNGRNFDHAKKMNLFVYHINEINKYLRCQLPENKIKNNRDIIFNLGTNTISLWIKYLKTVARTH